MNRSIISILLLAASPMAVSAPPASSALAQEGSCATITSLHRQRDVALKKQDFVAYCKTLQQLIRAMPPGEVRPEKLQCEATGKTDLATWKKIRIDVINTMTATHAQQCKR
jgi:hypothetical protein